MYEKHACNRNDVVNPDYLHCADLHCAVDVWVAIAWIYDCAMKQETGAPAALRRLEEHELRCAQECDKLKAERDRLRAMQEPEGDEALRNHHNAIQYAVSNLADAQDDWSKALKNLREFDRAVAPEKREGEKLLRADVEEFMQQVYISIDLGIESYIISLSQDATRAESPEAFYQAHADNLRSCKVAAIEKAIQDKKLPTWAKVL